MKPQPMDTAPKDRRILVWSPIGNGLWVGAKWNDDRYSKRPHPYWELDLRFFGKIEMREIPPLAWVEFLAPYEPEVGVAQ